MEHYDGSGETWFNCSVTAPDTLSCSDGETWVKAEGPLEYTNYLFWVYMSLSVVLVLFSGLCSGLTLGLLSLDLTTLSIIERGTDETKRKYATVWCCL